MITTSDRIIITSGSIVSYTGPTVYVTPIFEASNPKLTVNIQLRDSNQLVVGEQQFIYSTSTIAGAGGSGADSVLTFQNNCERQIKADLLALNPSATFTIV